MGNTNVGIRSNRKSICQTISRPNKHGNEHGEGKIKKTDVTNFLNPPYTVFQLFCFINPTFIAVIQFLTLALFVSVQALDLCIFVVNMTKCACCM